MFAIIRCRIFCLPIFYPETENKIDGTVILRIIFRGSVTLMEKHRVRVFVNRALRRIFDRTTDELTKKWRRLHNLELLICCPYQIFLR
jgi:hypothetical protein